jgi:hypothetical protein
MDNVQSLERERDILLSEALKRRWPVPAHRLPVL